MVTVSRITLRNSVVSVVVAATTISLLLGITGALHGDLRPTLEFNGALVIAAASWLALLTIHITGKLARRLDRLRIAQQLEESPSRPAPARLHLVTRPGTRPERARQRPQAVPLLLFISVLILVGLGILTPRATGETNANPASVPPATTITSTMTVTVTVSPAAAAQPAPGRRTAPASTGSSSTSSTTEPATSTSDAPTTTPPKKTKTGTSAPPTSKTSPADPATSTSADTTQAQVSGLANVQANTQPKTSRANQTDTNDWR